MAVIQEAFNIPDDIARGIATGLYRRIGGVVRYATGSKKGQIVKHLDPVNLKAAEQAQTFGEKAMQFVANNKKGIAIGTATATGAFFTVVYFCYKAKTRKPSVVTEFSSKLHIYIEEIRNGKLKLDTINNLMAALDAIKQHKDYNKYSITLSAGDLDVLVNQIYDYTIKLAENNGMELTERERRQTDNSIINLQNCLKAQRRIFEKAA